MIDETLSKCIMVAVDRCKEIGREKLGEFLQEIAEGKHPTIQLATHTWDAEGCAGGQSAAFLTEEGVLAWQNKLAEDSLDGEEGFEPPDDGDVGTAYFEWRTDEHFTWTSHQLELDVPQRPEEPAPLAELPLWAVDVTDSRSIRYWVHAASAEEAHHRVEMSEDADDEFDNDVVTAEWGVAHVEAADGATDHDRLTATFRPQVWHDDHAVNLEGLAVTFDATEKLLELSLREIQTFRENHYDSDRLAEDLPCRQQHGGPFEVDVDINEWLEGHGITEGRANLTQEQLDALRRKFHIVPETE